MKCKWQSFVYWALSEPTGAIIAVVAALILFGILVGLEGYAAVQHYAAPYKMSA